jgi:hypothetical protein
LAFGPWLFSLLDRGRQHSRLIQRRRTPIRNPASRIRSIVSSQSGRAEKLETFRPDSLETLLRIQWKLISGLPGNFAPESAGVGREYGYADSSGVTQAVKRLEARAATDRTIAKRLGQLRQLSKVND